MLMRDMKFKVGDPVDRSSIPGLGEWPGGKVEKAEPAGMANRERYEIKDDEGGIWHLHMPGEEAPAVVKTGVDALKSRARRPPRAPKQQSKEEQSKEITLVPPTGERKAMPSPHLGDDTAPLDVVSCNVTFTDPAKTAVAPRDDALAAHDVKVGPAMHFELPTMDAKARVRALDGSDSAMWQVGWSQTTVSDFAVYRYPGCRLSYDIAERQIDTLSSASAPFAADIATAKGLEPGSSSEDIPFADAPGDWVPVVDPSGDNNESRRLSAASLRQRFDLYLIARHMESGQVAILERRAWEVWLDAEIRHTADGTTLAQIKAAGGKTVEASGKPPELGGGSAIATAHTRLKRIPVNDD